MAGKPSTPGRIARHFESGRRRMAAVPFGLRLFAALAVALALVGLIAFALISDELEQHQIDVLAGEQQADAEGMEGIGRELPPKAALREIGEVLEVIGNRPGTDEAVLVGPDRRIVAASDDSMVGELDDEEQITAALNEGESRYGREVDPGEEASNFEFVTPVTLPGGDHALEMSISNESFEAQLAGIQDTLLLIGAIALFGVAGLFYLFGGRSLLRSHTLALERATRDGLTDLPNQSAFATELEQAASAAERSQQPLAVAVFDVDHFKLINDRFGHAEGDTTLNRVADVLREGRSADRGYRVGGDEFAVIMPNTDVEGARTLSERLSRQLKEADAPSSVGVSVMRSRQAPDLLREEADAASYEAKRLGGGRAVQFEDIRDDASVTSAVKREAVERLIDEKRLRIVFQPIWAFSPPHMIGIEALMRPESTLGFTGPADAFDVAEQIRRVPDLDHLCARTALRSYKELVRDRDDHPPLWLNFAPQTLEYESPNPGWLSALVEEAGVAKASVVIEVTERIGARTAKVVEVLDRIRRSGFKLALDDVGTGNAGLEMLHKARADFVKLDGSIVAAAPTDPNARAVLMAMSAYAAQTGAFVVAEGVEDEETLAFLRRIGDYTEDTGDVIQGAQGFGLGRPSDKVPGGIPGPLAAEAEPSLR